MHSLATLSHAEWGGGKHFLLLSFIENHILRFKPCSQMGIFPLPANLQIQARCPSEPVNQHLQKTPMKSEVVLGPLFHWRPQRHGGPLTSLGWFVGCGFSRRSLLWFCLGLLPKIIWKLQLAQNTAFRVWTGPAYLDHVSLALKELLWPAVSFRAKSRVLVLIFIAF